MLVLLLWLAHGFNGRGGIDDLLNRKNWYIAQHMQQIQRRIVLACAGQNDDTIKQHLLGNLSPQYSKNFDSVGAYINKSLCSRKSSAERS